LAWNDTTKVWACTSISGVGAVNGTGINGQVAFWSGTSSQTGSNSLFWNNASGYLGIGSSNASATLDVSGTAYLRGSTANTGLFVASNGNVGVGTTGPQTLFAVGPASNFRVDASGNVLAGTWQANTISAQFGGTGLNAGTAPAGALLIGNGTGFGLGTISGDGTLASNGAFTLASTGVTAGTYGSANTVPVIQVDAKGRIISASTAAGSFIGGAGTTNYVARFSSNNSITTGTLYDNGASIGIGTTGPRDTLDITGASDIGITLDRAGVA
jgi:hypothetical protein